MHPSEETKDSLTDTTKEEVETSKPAIEPTETEVKE